jgi:hypothetical protein
MSLRSPTLDKHLHAVSELMDHVSMQAELLLLDDY